MTLEIQLERPPATPGAAVVDEPARPDAAAPVAFAGVVHDLGNLIQIATSVLSIVSRNPEMPAATRDSLFVKARASLDHAGALVRQTLRVASGGTQETDGVSVAGCLFEIRSLLDALWGPPFQLDIWIEVNLPHARCDQLALQNAILNLVYNAHDAMPDGGAVTVRASRATAAHGGEQIEVSVGDSGVGMSPETVARAFEPFFTTKSEGLGGIGLPMVERFVRGVGGEITIESEPGLGTTVVMRLPAVPGGTDTTPAAHASTRGVQAK